MCLKSMVFFIIGLAVGFSIIFPGGNVSKGMHDEETGERTDLLDEFEFLIPPGEDCFFSDGDEDDFEIIPTIDDTVESFEEIYFDKSQIDSILGLVDRLEEGVDCALEKLAEKPYEASLVRSLKGYCAHWRKRLSSLAGDVFLCKFVEAYTTENPGQVIASKIEGQRLRLRQSVDAVLERNA